MDLSTREGRRQQGKLIQAAARDAGLSAEDLASIAECSRALIYQYYSGATLVQTDRLQRIARAVGRSMAFFFGEDGVPLAEPVPAPSGPPTAADEAPALAPAHPAEEAPREDLPLPNLERALADLEDLARAQEGPPDPQGLVRTAERILALARVSGRQRTEAEACFRLGNAYGALGRHGEAAQALRQAIEIARQIELGPLRTQATHSLGAALLSVGACDEARGIFERQSDSPVWAARWRALVARAALAEQECDLDAALELLAETLASCEEAPSPEEASLARCYALGNQGNVHLALGDLAQALEAARACEREADRLGARDQRVEAMVNSGIALTGLGRYGEARETLSLAARLAWFAADLSRSLVARSFAAWNEALAGRHETALADGRDVCRQALREGDERTRALVHANLARIHQRVGRADEAAYHAEEAAQSLRALRFTAEALAAEVIRCAVSPGHASTARLAQIAESAVQGGLGRLEAEARLALARAGETPLEHATAAFVRAERMGDPDVRCRAAALAARHAPAEDRAWCARAVEAVESMRQGDAGPGEAVLEDPERLLVCRRHLWWLGQEEGEASREWLDDLAWPPVEERGPAQGWET